MSPFNKKVAKGANISGNSSSLSGNVSKIDPRGILAAALHDVTATVPHAFPYQDKYPGSGICESRLKSDSESWALLTRGFSICIEAPQVA